MKVRKHLMTIIHRLLIPPKTPPIIVAGKKGETPEHVKKVRTEIAVRITQEGNFTRARKIVLTPKVNSTHIKLKYPFLLFPLGQGFSVSENTQRVVEEIERRVARRLRVVIIGILALAGGVFTVTNKNACSRAFPNECQVTMEKPTEKDFKWKLD